MPFLRACVQAIHIIIEKFIFLINIEVRKTSNQIHIFNQLLYLLHIIDTLTHITQSKKRLVLNLNMILRSVKHPLLVVKCLNKQK